MKLTRAKLEQMMAPLVERTMEPVKKALADAKQGPTEIDEVVLVGGSTRIPLVQEAVKKFFGKEPHKGVNPDEVVASARRSRRGVLSGDVKDIVLLDVTPLSLGVETLGGVMTRLIARNTTIPTQEEGDLLDGVGQPDLGRGARAAGRARPMAGTTARSASFHLEGILPAPRGVPAGRGHLRHRRQRHPQRGTPRTRPPARSRRSPSPESSGLSKDEIEKMVKDAAAHEAEDKKRREEIETKNRSTTSATRWRR